MRKLFSPISKKREAAVRHGIELADERSAIAFQAHTTNDKKATKRLQEIHQAIAIHGSALASLDAALRAAATKVEHAKSALAVRASEGRRAQVALGIAGLHRPLEEARQGARRFGQRPLRRGADQATTRALRRRPDLRAGERPMLLALSDTVFEGRVGRRLAPPR
jgi:hypothetical protein